MTVAKKKTEWNSIDLSKVSFLKDLKSLKVRDDILARVVRWQLAKRRAGTHETKEEAEVRGSGKKLFRQKGTGRARQGGRRAPHMRGGAIIFGPQMRDHSFSLQKKVRRLGLLHAIAYKLQNDNLSVVESLQLGSFKTKELEQNLKALTPSNKVLFVDEQNDNLVLGSRNCIGVDVLPVIGLNVYDILNHDALIFSKDALSKVEKRLSSDD
ncbi:MAG: 50S ribosomal protein L4 [Alphaproteobacteria bacterium]|nr:MAG: 50S ribosomal protein L4 [Alphaproteobacteria bacterium]